MTKNILFLIKIILVFLFCFCLGEFTYFLLKLNIVPVKYLVVLGIVVAFLFLIILFCIFKKGKAIGKVISVLLILLLSGISIMGTQYLKNTYDFLLNTKMEYDTLSYSVLVARDKEYEKIEDLKEKEILYLDNEYKEDIKKELAKKITYKENVHQEFGSILDNLFNGTVDAIILEESFVTIAKEEIEDFESRIKTIDTFEIRTKAHIEKEENKNSELTKNPFILYISGIDQWGNVDSVRGRSDVNQLVIVNPLTHHILLLNTPRDYYVQLDGTTGLKDKLTHAGIYGIEKSIRTLENLYRVDISHYVRVNFNTVVKLVDVIGGIDIYSDKSFQAWTNKEVYVEKGWNHFDGKASLAYARERYTYLTGDHHRGANQQQVITAILEKVTKSNILISKYNSILNALNGSFQTDLTLEEITSFIKYQLDKMPSWKIESMAVTGSGSMDYTHSMGTKYKLYVMVPNENSVENAKKKINEVLNERE